MALRQVQVRVNDEHTADVLALAEKHGSQDSLVLQSTDNRNETLTALVLITIGSQATQNLVDDLRQTIPTLHGGVGSIQILPVEARTPASDHEEEEGPSPRETILSELRSQSRLSSRFILFLLLSAIITNLGLRINDVTVIIGAMVIAPLLGPILGTGFALVLGDAPLLRRAVVTETAGLVLAVLAGWAVTIILPGTAAGYTDQILLRAEPNFFHLTLALASGVAGTLSLTSGISTALVGVAVAVALMPPAVVIGIGLAQGEMWLVQGASLLLAVNVLAAALSSVVTFLAQGFRPRRAYLLRQARRSTRLGLVVITLMLILFLVPVGKLSLDTYRQNQMFQRVSAVITAEAEMIRVQTLRLERSGGAPVVVIQGIATAPVGEQTLTRLRQSVSHAVPAGHGVRLDLQQLQRIPLKESAP